MLAVAKYILGSRGQDHGIIPRNPGSLPPRGQCVVRSSWTPSTYNRPGMYQELNKCLLNGRKSHPDNLTASSQLNASVCSGIWNPHNAVGPTTRRPLLQRQTLAFRVNNSVPFKVLIKLAMESRSPRRQREVS